MKKIILPIVLVALGCVQQVNAQVGINTPTPTSTFDITAKEATGTAKTAEGLLIPRVDRQRAQSMTGVPTSTMIYVNSIATGTASGTATNIDAVGYYYYNGTEWTKLIAGGSTNIYTADGTLAGNRIVTQGANTLAFTGSATNAVSVDGSTLSVDAANHRLGIGTSAPENRFHVVSASPNSNRFILFDAPTGINQHVITSLRNTSPLATGNYALIGFTNSGPTGGGAAWGMGSVRTGNTGSPSEEEFMLGNSLGGSYVERLRVTSSGSIGLGTSTPQKLLHVNGALQVVNELNVGGNATTAGSAGTSGQVLTSNGAGAAPSWSAAPADTNTNIYTNDGTLAGNRIVTQGANTLAFTGSATNAVSVDGSTLSVDAANHRLGIGTSAPENRFHVVSASPNSNRFILFDAPTGINQHVITSLRNTSPLATGNYALIGFTNSGPTGGGAAWGKGSVRTGNTGSPSEEEFMLGNSLGGSYLERLRVTSSGSMGLGTSTPQKLLHVNGALQVVNELNVGGNATTAGSAGTSGQVLTSAGAGAAPSWQTLNTSSGTIASANYAQGTTAVTIAQGTTADVPGATITLTVPTGKTQTFLFTIIGYASLYNGNTSQGVFSLLQNGVKISSAYASKAGQFPGYNGGDTLTDMPIPVTFLKSVSLPAGTYTFKVQYSAWRGSATVNFIPSSYGGYNGDTEAMLTKMQVLVYNN